MVGFDVIELEQGTEDWHLWRCGGIGASDAPVIMGETRLKSIDALRHERETTWFRPTISSLMARGMRLEPIARDAYCCHIKFTVAPMCLQSKSKPWMRSSVDGICLERSHVVEIKCGESAYRSTSASTVPFYYYGQLQHILAVTNFASIDFWCYLPNKRPKLARIARNDWYIRTLVQREEDFWDSIKDNLPFPS